MFCKRVRPEEYGDLAAKLYTAQCVEQLTRSKAFRDYASHVCYRERLFLSWFIAPIGLFVVLYFHLALFGDELGMGLAVPRDGNLPWSGNASARLLGKGGSGSSNSSAGHILPYVTLLLLLYLLPCMVTAPFVGFFDEPSARESAAVYAMLTLVNLLAVSFGGTLLHYPPMLYTNPPIPLTALFTRNTGGAPGLAQGGGTMARLLLVRLLPLQGYLSAGYLVSMWQRAHWRRVWHLPLPLVSVPLLVGLAGLCFWRLAALLTPYFIRTDGSVTDVTAALQPSSLLEDPAGVWSLYGTVLRLVMQSAWAELRELGRRLALDGPRQVLLRLCTPSLYLATLSMTTLYFLALMMQPVMGFVLRALLHFLPTQPTVWLLSVAGVAAALVKTVYAEHVVLGYVCALVMLLLALLFKGFVA